LILFPSRKRDETKVLFPVRVSAFSFRRYYDGLFELIVRCDRKMTPQPSSPTEMSYSQLVKLAPPTTTPAANQTKHAMPRTAPPTTINVYDRRIAFPPFSSQVPMSAPRAGVQNSNEIVDPTTIENRLSNLELKLQSSNSIIDQTNHQTHPSNNSLGEIHQFIDILKNMQNVVSTTVDEQQRGKKARALNTLLTMFESIIDERRPSTQHLEWRIQYLERENLRLQCLCKDSETTLQRQNQAMAQLQQDVQRMAADNDRVRNDLVQAQDQCHQEYIRAKEAEQVASESEKTRNGLLASYGRLTEENVDLLRAIEDADCEQKVLSKTLASIREEVDALRNQTNQLHKQLRDSNKQKKELEILLDHANSRLETQKHDIQAANEDRQRIQDELHRSQRNSTATSEQLMKLRDEFTKKLQADRSSKSIESLATKLEDEQIRRRELEDLVTRAKEREDSAAELMKKLARSNAELRSQVNQMVARINQPPGTLECLNEALDLPVETKESDNLSCYF